MSDDAKMQNIFNTIEHKQQEFLLKNREEGRCHYAFLMEKEILSAVTDGDLIHVRELMELPLLLPISDDSTPTLRQQKNTCVTSIGLLARAAVNGGVFSEIAFASNDTYVDAIELCDSLEELTDLQKYATLSFTKLVLEYRQNTTYSKCIVDCMEYIQSHILEKIPVTTLTQIAHLSQRQLERKFREELTCSIVSYINTQRILTAKNLLRFSDYSVSAISSYLNFCTESYFIAQFKKYTGVSPRKFRDECR